MCIYHIPDLIYSCIGTLSVLKKEHWSAGSGSITICLRNSQDFKYERDDFRRLIIYSIERNLYNG